MHRVGIQQNMPDETTTATPLRFILKGDFFFIFIGALFCTYSGAIRGCPVAIFGIHFPESRKPMFFLQKYKFRVKN